MAVRVRINQAAMQRLMTSPDGPVVRHVAGITRRVRNEIVRRAPVDEGRLRASFDTSVETRGRQVVGRVWSPLDYALYLHTGTGIYGPKGTVIRPRRREALRFKPGRGRTVRRAGSAEKPRERRGGWVFAKYVRGTPRNLFIVDGFQAGCPYPIRWYR